MQTLLFVSTTCSGAGRVVHSGGNASKRQSGAYSGAIIFRSSSSPGAPPAGNSADVLVRRVLAYVLLRACLSLQEHQVQVPAIRSSPQPSAANWSCSCVEGSGRDNAQYLAVAAALEMCSLGLSRFMVRVGDRQACVLRWCWSCALRCPGGDSHYVPVCRACAAPRSFSVPEVQPSAARRERPLRVRVWGDRLAHCA